MKKVFIVFIVLLFAVFSSSCDREMLKNKLIVGSYIGEGISQILVAEKEGFFKKYGVNVEIKEYEAGIYAIDDISKGIIDIATPTEVAFVSKSFDMPDLKILSLLSIVNFQSLIVRTDSGIRKPEDLIGKKIATTRGSSSEYALASFLTNYNINIAEITIIDLKPSELLDAFKNKKIDGALFWEPHIYKIKKELHDEITDISNNKVPSVYTVIVSKDETIGKKQKEMEAFLAACVDAEIFITKNTDQAKAIVMNRMATTDEYIEYAWKNLIITIGLPQDIIFAMENEAKWRIDNKLTNAKLVPNYVKYFSFDSLEKVKPDSITIIR